MATIKDNGPRQWYFITTALQIGLLNNSSIYSDSFSYFSPAATFVALLDLPATLILSTIHLHRFAMPSSECHDATSNMSLGGDDSSDEERESLTSTTSLISPQRETLSLA
jgi:hypothetical protein